MPAPTGIPRRSTALRPRSSDGDDRHRDRRLHRHAGAPRRQARVGAALPRGRRRARRRGVQLPARRRRRDEHRRRLRDVELGARLRRHGADPRLRHAARWRRGSPATALVTADLQWLDGTPVEAVAPADPAAPARAPRRARASRAFVGTELEFIVFDDTLPRRLGARATATSRRRATTTSTTRCSPPRAWSRCCATSATRWTAPACTARASRASATSASRRSPSATPTRSAPATTTRSTRTARRRSPTGTASRSPSWRSSTSARATAATSTSRCAATDGEAVFADDGCHARHVRRSSSTSSPASSPPCASSRCSSRRTSTPTSATSTGSFAPTADRLGPRQPHLRAARRRPRPRLRVENRVPGGDVNQYLAVAALIAAGLHGIEQRARARDVFVGNAYESDVAARAGHAARGGRRCSPARRSRARPSATRSSSTT